MLPYCLVYISTYTPEATPRPGIGILAEHRYYYYIDLSINM